MGNFSCLKKLAGLYGQTGTSIPRQKAGTPTLVAPLFVNPACQKEGWPGLSTARRPIRIILTGKGLRRQLKQILVCCPAFGIFPRKISGCHVANGPSPCLRIRAQVKKGCKLLEPTSVSRYGAAGGTSQSWQFAFRGLKVQLSKFDFQPKQAGPTTHLTAGLITETAAASTDSFPLLRLIWRR